MKKIYLALRFPAVWPKAPTVGAGGSFQFYNHLDTPSSSDMIKLDFDTKEER
jgi:hypothetical protein